MKRLVVCDFDGTICRKNDLRHTERVLKNLKQLPNDVVFAVASGRPLHLLKNYFKEFKNIYIISCDGALITKGAEKIFEFPISKELLEKICQYPEWVAYGECISYLRYNDKSRGREWMNMYKSHAVSVLDINDIEENIYKIFIPKKIKEIDGLSKCYSGFEMSEFVNEKVDKGKAVAFLRKNLGIDKASVVAFGDGENDISMFKEAGKSLAYIGASPSIKAVADKTFSDLGEELLRL